ncbi:MAG: ABC transporter ATP-binding protein [Acidobacteriota bacterium]
MSEAALAFEEVTVAFPGSQQPALNRCSLEVGTFERVALLGLNGSGKTTLLLAAVGLVPSSGRIRVAGEELLPKRFASLRQRMGFLFAIPEDQLLLPRIGEDVALPLSRNGLSSQEARALAARTLAELGISDLADKAPFQLSHGQRLLAALAGILAPRPPLLLLDEPTSRLDPPSRRRLADVLAQRAEAVLVATHDLEFAARLCGRYVLLDRGRVVETGDDFHAVEHRWKNPDEHGLAHLNPSAES